jgi:hypothetical protein
MDDIHIEWKESKANYKIIQRHNLKITVRTHYTAENIMQPTAQIDKCKQSGFYQMKLKYIDKQVSL